MLKNQATHVFAALEQLRPIIGYQAIVNLCRSGILVMTLILTNENELKSKF